MGALVFWLGVGLLVALVLVAARAIDRRDRRRGHLRSSGEMSRDAREHRRDAVAGDSAGHLSSDRSWTAHSRQVENRPREPDERPGA